MTKRQITLVVFGLGALVCAGLTKSFTDFEILPWALVAFGGINFFRAYRWA